METHIELGLRAGGTMFWLSSPEEDRSLPRVQAVAETLRYAVFQWQCNNAFVQRSAGKFRHPGDGQCTNVDQALAAVAEYRHQPTVFIFCDLDMLVRRIENSPDYVLLVRRIKDLYRILGQTGCAIVFLASTPAIPAELQDCLTLVEAALPDREERLAIIKAWIVANCQEIPCQLDEEGLYRLASAAAGMSSRQIQSTLAASVVKHRELASEAVDDVLVEKAAVVKASEVLEYVQVGETLEDVGGLAAVKDYVRKRALSFGPAAARYGLPSPRGILLTGPPGTGKSLVAKTAAHALQMPLLRFDLGRLMGSLVGQSEERLRRALAIAETVAPCVLWIDELEKAFAGVGGPSGDSGVSQRLFGSLLTWLQEWARPVFVVATANNISQLPPEFLRRGRFDELFFVDLPTAAERKAILQVLLRKRGLPAKGLITEALVARLDRYTGAELDCLVVEAMFESSYDDQRPVTRADLEAAATRILPLADQQREQIEALRRWGRTNARPAS